MSTDNSANPIPGPDAGEFWLSAEKQSAPPASERPQRSYPSDVRCALNVATAMYTDYDTGEVRTWWQQAMHLQQLNMSYARELSALREINSDMQNLWGRKPEFRDDWFEGYIPEYRRPNPRADLTSFLEIYGSYNPPWPAGPLPGGGY